MPIPLDLHFVFFTDRLFSFISNVGSNKVLIVKISIYFKICKKKIMNSTEVLKLKYIQSVRV